MMPHYCNKGHENLVSSNFCIKCGEKLDLPVLEGIYPGLLLGDRYQIVRQLGHSSIGSTYLAEDTNRGSAPCVLKEFAPLLPQTAYALQKAEELFEREAGVLYKLQHPQIPRFRELFRVSLNVKDYLFLVQDYESGHTYRALLNVRKFRGLQFSEVEVLKLLLQILPVLEYIHSMGVIHQNISPDNLILRSSDSLPVLIDFGDVKQVAATVAWQFNLPESCKPASPATLLGKLCYAPYEQMQMGRVYPHSDLYALAATVLVLLTGKEPQELIDDNTLSWNWRQEVNLSPTLGAVLDKMLLPTPSKRYQSARQVLQALTEEEAGNQGSRGGALCPPGAEESVEVSPLLPCSPASPAPPAPPASPASPAPPAPPAPPASPASPDHASNWSLFTPGKILLTLLLFAGAGSAGWWGGNLWLQFRQSTALSSTATKTSQATFTSPYILGSPPWQSSPEKLPSQEKARLQALFNRGKALGIDEDFLFGGRGLINQVFYSQHPEQRQRILTSKPVDADLRSQWYTTADALLDTLDKQLSSEARQKLGHFTAQSGDLAKAEVNQLHLSRGDLNNFLNQPIGQVWQALVEDKVKTTGKNGSSAPSHSQQKTPLNASPSSAKGTRSRVRAKKRVCRRDSRGARARGCFIRRQSAVLNQEI